VCDWEAFDVVSLFDGDGEAAIVHCYFGRPGCELDEGVHFLLVEGLNEAPEPFYDCRFGRVAFVLGLAYEHFD
jgi:hypothetical protein